MRTARFTRLLFVLAGLLAVAALPAHAAAPAEKTTVVVHGAHLFAPLPGRHLRSTGRHDDV